MRTRGLAFGVSVVLLALPAAARAHEKKSVGALQLTIGWGDEPAFTGAKNSVDVDVSDAAHAPVTDPAGRLAVEISFGDQRMSLSLLPAGRQPGKFKAWLVPTRAGTYTFHITGTLKGQAIDTTSTCSETTFHCVADVSDIQFPVRDPSLGQLADRVSRSLPRAEQAMDRANTVRGFSMAALAAAALALVTAIGLGARKGRKSA